MKRETEVAECKAHLYATLTARGLAFIRTNRGLSVGEGVQHLIDLGEIDPEWAHQRIQAVYAATCEIFLELTVKED